MRFFYLLDFQHWLLAIFLGGVLTILVYLAFRSYGYSAERADEKAHQEFHYPEGIKGKNFPTPPFIIFLYLGFFVWIIAYVIVVGLMGGPM